MAWNNISTNRAILFPSFADAASAQYGAGEAQMFGELGYGVAVGNIAAEPFGGLAFVHLRSDGFAEAGGGRRSTARPIPTTSAIPRSAPAPPPPMRWRTA